MLKSWNDKIMRLYNGGYLKLWDSKKKKYIFLEAYIDE